MKVIERYETDDGLVWDTIVEAEAHEKKLIECARVLINAKEMIEKYTWRKYTYLGLIDELTNPNSLIKIERVK